MTFVKTIATLPAAIFYVSSTCLSISFVVLLFVRVPKPNMDVEGRPPSGATTPTSLGPMHAQDDTLVDVDVPVIVVDAASPKVGSSSRG